LGAVIRGDGRVVHGEWRTTLSLGWQRIWGRGQEQASSKGALAGDNISLEACRTVRRAGGAIKMDGLTGGRARRQTAGRAPKRASRVRRSGRDCRLSRLQNFPPPFCWRLERDDDLGCSRKEICKSLAGPARVATAPALLPLTEEGVQATPRALARHTARGLLGRALRVLRGRARYRPAFHA